MSQHITRIILVRHGRTAWNRQPGTGGVRFRGQADLPLDDFGLQQAAATARYLARRWSVEAVYASPMKRAMQTARPIAEAQGLTAQSFDGLLDIDFGDWQGKSPDDLKEEYPDLLRAWFEIPHTIRFPGGETLDDVRERAVAGLEITVEHHQDQTVAMVGHAVINRVLLCAILGPGNEGFWRLRQDTCAVNVFDVAAGGSATIVVLNDTCHLQNITS